MWIETTAITKKARLRYEPGEVPMVLPIGANDEPNKHLDTYVSVNRRCHCMIQVYDSRYRRRGPSIQNIFALLWHFSLASHAQDTISFIL
jgi:hypothetical protein